MSLLFSALYRTLSPAGSKARLSVLIFHRVLAARDPLYPSEPTVEEFEAKLRWVKEHFNVLALSEAVRGLKLGRLPDRPLSITFDDGYADNYHLALPILCQLGLPATFFIASGYLDGGCMFNDAVREAVRQATGPELDLSDLQLGRHTIATDEDRCGIADEILFKVRYLRPAEREATGERLARRVGAHVPRDLMMTSEQVAAMSKQGMEIGGHTVSHPALTSVDISIARQEIERGCTRLRDVVGERIALFAYPIGLPRRDYSTAHVRLVRELGFEGAVSTAWGTSGLGADPFQIPRFTPWDCGRCRFGLRLAQNLLRTKPLLA